MFFSDEELIDVRYNCKDKIIEEEQFFEEGIHDIDWASSVDEKEADEDGTK